MTNDVLYYQKVSVILREGYSLCETTPDELRARGIIEGHGAQWDGTSSDGLTEDFWFEGTAAMRGAIIQSLFQAGFIVVPGDALMA